MFHSTGLCWISCICDKEALLDEWKHSTSLLSGLRQHHKYLSITHLINGWKFVACIFIMPKLSWNRNMCPSHGHRICPQNRFYGLLPLVKVIEADRMWCMSQDWYLDLIAFREAASVATCTLNTWMSDAATTEERKGWRGEERGTVISLMSFALFWSLEKYCNFDLR